MVIKLFLFTFSNVEMEAMLEGFWVFCGMVVVVVNQMRPIINQPKNIKAYLCFFCSKSVWKIQHHAPNDKVTTDQTWTI